MYACLTLGKKTDRMMRLQKTEDSGNGILRFFGKSRGKRPVESRKG